MRATVRLCDTLTRHVESVRQDEQTSDAEAVRECVRRSERLADVEAHVDELDTEVDRIRRELNTEVGRLRREKRQILAEREEKAELARQIKNQRSAEQRLRKAGLVTRAKWLLVGMDDGEA
jgi:hypothetical protein